MFDRFVKRPFHLALYRNGPYAEERSRFLTHLVREGRGRSILIVAPDLDRCTAALNLSRAKTREGGTAGLKPGASGVFQKTANSPPGRTRRLDPPPPKQQRSNPRNTNLRYDCVWQRGPISQRSEQRTHNPLVPGSNPGGPTKEFLPTGSNNVPLGPTAGSRRLRPRRITV